MGPICIETPRLLIRRFRESDGPGLFGYLSDAQVVRYEPYGVFTREEAEAEARRRAGDEGFYAVTLKDGTLIGNIYLGKNEPYEYELGYVFNRNFQGMGYACEAARAVVDYGFKALDAHRVIAMCNPENERSWKLMERLSMRREAAFMKNTYFKKDASGAPIWQDTFIYAVLESEWPRAPSSSE